MPIYRSADATEHRMHGTVFRAFASPSTGSAELCAWRIEVAAGTAGVPHRVGRDEVLMISSGSLSVSLDGVVDRVEAGDVLLVPSGTEFRVDNDGPAPAEAWVTTSAGFAAVLPDGTTLTPPWAS
ncbi:cupin domain-containing protein [Actinoplanes sp. NEAU-A12]|uniref:Cupin domain-containing protein n=1 Tax=Actinoplanes sandaracinus TaxID=3045177 RepID=A0ABT6WPD8_9ACTN|nr:cupin domain-containing protein [Actinoplanes sandaracinus]MDI6101589.1 cupin domain-containing protein [Actinoplanes sandaracinus]